MGKYNMLKKGDLSLKDASLDDRYYEAYERLPTKTKSSHLIVFKIPKIEIRIHKNVLAFNVTFHNPPALLASRLSAACPGFSYGKYCHPNSTLVTLTFGLPAGATIRHFNPHYLLKLLENIEKIEPLGGKTKLSILSGLSHHTKKIAVFNDLAKIGNLSSLEKQSDLANIFAFREHYERIKHAANTKIKKINFCISTDDLVCVAITVVNNQSSLIPKSSAFSFEPFNDTDNILYWKETLQNLNENPNIIRHFVDYLAKIDPFFDKTKQEMLKGFSHHIKNLVTGNPIDEQKESEDPLAPAESPIFQDLVISRKPIVTQLELHQNKNNKPPEKDSWHHVCYKKFNKNQNFKKHP